MLDPLVGVLTDLIRPGGRGRGSGIKSVKKGS